MIPPPTWRRGMKTTDKMLDAMTYHGNRLAEATKMAHASYAYSRDHGLPMWASLCGALELWREYALPYNAELSRR